MHIILDRVRQAVSGMDAFFEQRSIPFHMLGLTGIVLSPPGSTHEFSSTDDIRRLFDDVEEHELRIERVRTEVAWNDHEFAAFFDSMGFEPAARLILEAEISWLRCVRNRC